MEYLGEYISIHFICKHIKCQQYSCPIAWISTVISIEGLNPKLTKTTEEYGDEKKTVWKIWISFLHCHTQQNTCFPHVMHPQLGNNNYQYLFWHFHNLLYNKEGTSLHYMLLYQALFPRKVKYSEPSVQRSCGIWDFGCTVNYLNNIL